MEYGILGERIAEARKKAGLSQAALGEACGWSDAQTRISNYERGEREPGLADLKRIAGSLGMTLTELIHGPDDPREMRLMEKLKRLGPERLRLIEDVVDAFLAVQRSR